MICANASGLIWRKMLESTLFGVKGETMPWIYLLIAGGFEIGFAVLLKMSEGFTKPISGIGSFLLGLLSFYFLTLAAETISISTAYAIWTGIGVIGITIIGIFFFEESNDLPRILCILLIVLGVVGLKLFSRE